MPAAEREEQQLALVEDGTDVTPVRQMAVVTAMVGIVGQKHVPGIDVIGKQFNQILYGERRAEKLYGQTDRDRNCGAIRAPDATRHVLKWTDQEVWHRGFNQGR